MSKDPPLPAPLAVKSAVRAFDEDPDTGPADRALATLFAQYPRNDSLESVLLKATAVNGLYATNVYALMAVSRHIFSLGIDSYLAHGDLAIVDRLADFTVGGKRRRIYSFATKYCSWHCSESFPIYDSVVASVLVAYRQRDAFSSFSKTDLRVYPRFVAVVADFRNYYDLQAFNFRDIDKFLWRLGRQRDAGG